MTALVFACWFFMAGLIVAAKGRDQILSIESMPWHVATAPYMLVLPFVFGTIEAFSCIAALFQKQLTAEDCESLTDRVVPLYCAVAAALCIIFR